MDKKTEEKQADSAAVGYARGVDKLGRFSCLVMTGLDTGRQQVTPTNGGPVSKSG